MYNVLTICILAFFFLSSSITTANESIPKQLKDWVPWVLHNYKDLSCPLVSESGHRQCIWPGSLLIEVSANQASFIYEVDVYKRDFVPVPGDERLWPSELMDNLQPVSPVAIGGRPQLFLEKGHHVIKGRIKLNGTNSITVPQGTALIKLIVNGKRILDPRLDTRHWQLFFSESKKEVQIERRPDLKIKVFKLIKDGVPVIIEVRLKMSVSGNARQICLSGAVPKGFRPLHGSFPFNWTFKNKGSLCFQVRPGNWEFVYEIASNGPVDEVVFWDSDLRLKKPQIWSFKHNPSIRRVELSGPVAVDPMQTEMPKGWHKYPAFYVKPGEKLVIHQMVRGAESPEPNDLSLDRTMWLAFDASRYFVRDEIHGTLNHGWRLNSISPLLLGRVEINHQPRLITLDKNGRRGVEIRKRLLAMVAEGEIKESIFRLRNLGWQQVFSSASINIFLPPGWTMIAALGADGTSGTWIDQWSLLDIFLLILLSWATIRCCGLMSGMLMFIFLILGINDPNAPVWLWLHPLIAMALLQIVKGERARAFLFKYRLLACLAILVVLVPYSVNKIKLAIYPQLSKVTYQHVGVEYEKDMPLALESATVGGFMGRSYKRKLKGDKLIKGQKDRVEGLSKDRLIFEPGAKIQTGPGLPDWKGQRVRIKWNGPVDCTQALSFYYISPVLNRILGIICGLLPLIILLILSGITRDGFKIWKGFITLAFLGAFLSMPVPAICADYPPKYLLDQLEKTVLEPPSCHPHCGMLEGAKLILEDHRLSFRFMVFAMEPTSLVLPVNLASWNPDSILFSDSKGRIYSPVVRRASSGYLQVALKKGRTNIIVSGPIEQDSLILPVPYIVHNVTVDQKSNRWTISGIDPFGNVQKQFRIIERDKKSSSHSKENAKAKSNGIPAFLKVLREFNLGLTWRVRTFFRRVSDYQGPVEIEYDLLEGERVITPGIRCKDGKACITLGQGQREFSFETVLERSSHLQLIASKNPLFMEAWKFFIASLWHVEFTGIPQVVQHGHEYEPLWMPWPGESISLSISKPKAAKGPIKTVRSCRLIQSPGPRLTKSHLTLEIVSSLGTNQVINLPEGCRMKKILVDGTAFTFDPDGRTFSLPLHPGVNRLSLEWLESRGLTTIFSTTNLDLGIPLTNIFINLDYPLSRWPLWVRGPVMGPAVIFWGALIMTLFIGILLGRLKGVPLSSYQWFFLGAGLLPIEPLMIIPVFLTFILFYLRAAYSERLRAIGVIRFNLMQMTLIGVALSAVFCLVLALQQGLLGHPDMQIQGNGSYVGHLVWYQDKADQFPECKFVSSSLWVYRGVMLVWSLWLVNGILKWIPWGWEAFSKDGTWKRVNLSFKPRVPGLKGKQKKSKDEHGNK